MSAVYTGTYYNQLEDALGTRVQRQINVNILEITPNIGQRQVKQIPFSVLELVPTLGSRNANTYQATSGLSITVGQRVQHPRGGGILSGDNNYVPPRRTPSDATWQNTFWTLYNNGNS